MDEQPREVGGGRAHHATQRERQRLGRAPQTHPDALAPTVARAGQAHHRADGRDREGATGRTEQEDIGPQRPGRANQAGRDQAAQRRARGHTAPHRPAAQAAPAAARPAAARAGRQQHANQCARMLGARQPRGTARCEAKHQTGEGLQDEVLHAVSQHRHEDKDREAARTRLGPGLAQRRSEGLARASGLGSCDLVAFKA
mmetsp:Transcript_16510/g.64434  ORF Transcript_16510/g.64434 Transcript_16510/m.64434 type:complete len:200 (+) Transcript_16510:1023-1622(+)